MATVAAFRIAGLKLWFWSGDHEPPHFHAKRTGEWEVRVRFLERSDDMIELVWKEKRPSASVLTRLRVLAGAHRAELFEQWEKIHAE